MVEWKTKINPILIQDNDIFNNICVYNTQTGEYQIKTRSEVGIRSVNDTWIGSSKQHGRDIFGIFASDIGPVFFINNKMYPLCGTNWSFTVGSLSQDENVFRFHYNNELVCEILYKKEDALGTHPYSNENFDDFFVWLSNKKKSKTFIDYYTTKP